MLQQTSLRRSQLGIPGNEDQLVSDAIDSGADELFFDLEDSLAPSEKEHARAALVDTILSEDWSKTVLSYRINGIDTRWWYEDIIEVVSAVGGRLDTVIVPKVRGPTDVRTVATLLSSVEASAGIEPGSIGLNPQIETANGMNSVTEIAHSSDRITAIIFGPADYAASVGAAHGATDYPGHYWHYPLSRIAHAAASAGLLAIGGPYTDPEDLEGFTQECRYERALGFDGKLIVHPKQVETTNKVFAPTIEEAERAEQIVLEYEQKNQGAVAAIEGNVIDREMYHMAKQILMKARAAGLI